MCIDIKTFVGVSMCRPWAGGSDKEPVGPSSDPEAVGRVLGVCDASA